MNNTSERMIIQARKGKEELQKKEEKKDSEDKNFNGELVQDKSEL